MAADPVITSDVARGVRRHVRIGRSAAEVWDRIGDPARLHEWFPGIASTQVDGTTRVVATAAGVPIPEQIVTNDPLQRRFQYRITGPMFRQHLSTLDVLDLDDGTCVVAYAADAEPSTLALVVAGAAGNALDHLRRLMEGDQ
jgi:carbon monoxide dehydrogenase subunit G